MYTGSHNGQAEVKHLFFNAININLISIEEKMRAKLTNLNHCVVRYDAQQLCCGFYDINCDCAEVN